MPPRDAPEHAGAGYYLRAEAATGQAPLGEAGDREQFLALLELVRQVFQARVYAYGLRAEAMHLAIALAPRIEEREQALFDRWRRLAARATPPADRLRARLRSVSGFMQTLLQRFTRTWNAHRGTRGALWAPRFRSVILADDCALLAATTWIERRAGAQSASSRGLHDRDSAVSLSAPPLALGPGDFLCPSDDAPPGCSPPAPGETEGALARFAQALSPEALEAHGRALAHGWALGRPESLAGVIDRLGRHGGRGRGRRLRDLGEELGLYGVWG